jgi:hypothetical protein
MRDRPKKMSTKKKPDRTGLPAESKELARDSQVVGIPLKDRMRKFVALEQ